MAETIDLLEVKAAARKVLEEVFPADDEAALIAAVTPDFVNHEAPPGTAPGPAGGPAGRGGGSLHAVNRASRTERRSAAA